MISEFHSLVDKQHGCEVRLLEADARATVAINPVYLYVIVTNGSSGSDAQSYVWLLPYKVEKVDDVRLSSGGLHVRAQVDADPERSQTTAQIDLEIKYTITGGKLANALIITKEPL